MNSQNSLADNPYALFGDSVSRAQPDVRAAFIRKTYTHLAAAIYAFAALEWFYFQSGIAKDLTEILMGAPYGMLFMLGGFMVVGWIANRWAMSDTSAMMQYAGLGLYVVFESLFMAPMLYFANMQTIKFVPSVTGTTPMEVGVIPAAGGATLLIFGALTAVAWFSGKDFSFLRAGLAIAGMGAFALIAASCFFNMNLGIWFSVAMIVFAAGYILYDTSNIMRRYPADKHVAASLALFASVALLFLYVLRLFMSLSSRD